jgi:hypothetical protein
MKDNSQTAQYCAKEYLFDLNSTAAENGFKADERWEVHMSTGDEKKAIEKQYYPTVVSAIMPDLLSATFRLVKALLKQPVKEQAASPECLYLVAYSAGRIRR